MGLNIPNLDIKNFEQLMEETLAKLPAFSDSWTEYNTSDPGITIIELLAWITDVNSYRLNRLGKEQYLAFLNLLSDIPASRDMSKKEIRKSLLAFGNHLPAPTRAVTLKDYEYFALHTPELKGKLARAKATADKATNKVTVLVIPHSEDSKPNLKTTEKKSVKKYLENKKLLTTKICMTKATYVPIDVSVTLFTQYGDPVKMREEIRLILKKFLHPLYGGTEGKGWAFGEDVHISHIYLLLNKLNKVDRIDTVNIKTDTDTEWKQKVTIEENSLPSFGEANIVVYNPKVPGVCDA